jgi:hypothetical protein
MSERPLTAIAFAFVLALIFAAGASPAFAQGSTGGTLGKTDQSLSGGTAKASQGKAERETPRAGGANQAKSQGAGLCGRVAGNWKYTSIGSYDVTLHPNGTGTSSSGQTATWTCANGRATVTWSAGFVDNLKVMPDGNHLLGSNGLGGISVTRR